jgi:hypothetical protein
MVPRIFGSWALKEDWNGDGGNAGDAAGWASAREAQGHGAAC